MIFLVNLGPLNHVGPSKLVSGESVALQTSFFFEKSLYCRRNGVYEFIEDHSDYIRVVSFSIDAKLSVSLPQVAFFYSLGILMKTYCKLGNCLVRLVATVPAIAVKHLVERIVTK